MRPEEFNIYILIYPYTSAHTFTFWTHTNALYSPSSSG